MQLITNKESWKQELELHKTSQHHAEWAARQVLKHLKLLRLNFGWDKGTEHFSYLREALEARFFVRAEHKALMTALVNKQLEQREA